jgi:hypothetical protein
MTLAHAVGAIGSGVLPQMRLCIFMSFHSS